MTNTVVRQVQGDEMLDILFDHTTYAFHATPPLRDKDEWKEMAIQRKGVTGFALFEDKKPLAIAVESRMTQQLRSALFGMGGVWGVATDPAARRKGYSRRLLTTLLGAIRDDERPLSCLYPFRESFYERLGYVTFPLQRKVIFDIKVLAPLVEKDLPGEVELVLISDGYDDYYDYLRLLQARVHGWALFEGNKAAAQQNNFWLALARLDGEPVGLMLYDLKGEQVTKFKMRAIHFYYHKVEGRYLLLEWIARHIDQADQVEIWVAPDELPETWLVDLQVKTQSLIRSPMGRVVDVAKIGGMRTGPGAFSARISDPFCPWNEGIWRFETLDGILQVSSVDQADCDLSIQALSALVYGTIDPEDFALRGWGNPSPGLQETLRGVFPPKLPYIHEIY